MICREKEHLTTQYPEFSLKTIRRHIMDKPFLTAGVLLCCGVFKKIFKWKTRFHLSLSVHTQQEERTVQSGCADVI